MKDRFDLEDTITNLYSTVEDLRCVADMMYDSNIIYTEDLRHTVLHGIAEVLDAKLTKAMDTFEQVFQLNDYAPEDVKAAREEVFANCRAMMKELKDAEDSVEQVFPNMAKMAEGWEEDTTLRSRVLSLLNEYEAMSVPVMAKMVGALETSVSATLRDLRKAKNGGHNIISFEQDGCTKYKLLTEDDIDDEAYEGM